MYYYRLITISLLVIEFSGISNAGLLNKKDYGIMFMNILKIFKNCVSKENQTISYCIKEKAIIGLDTICQTSRSFELIPNTIFLIKNEEILLENRSGKYLLEDAVKQSPENRSDIVNDLLIDTLTKFMNSRSINIKIRIKSLDIFHDDSKSEISGRGKKDKGGGALMIGAWMIGTAIAMKIAAIAAISGKALITSLLAFTLAAIATFKKSSGEQHAATYEVINVPAGGHHHGRSVLAAASNNFQTEPQQHLFYKPVEEYNSAQN